MGEMDKEFKKMQKAWSAFRKLIVILLLMFLIGCSTIATQSQDGKTLAISGNGKAKFENGALIEGRPIFELPNLPPIEMEFDDFN